MRYLMSILILTFAFTALAADHEVDVGAVELGGTAAWVTMGGDLYESGGDQLTVINIMPQVSYFVSPGLAMGGVVLYNKMGYNSSDDITTFGIGPTVVYYFFREGQKTLPFLSASFLYQKITSVGDISSTTIQLSGGVLVKLVPHFGLKAGLHYDADKSEGITGNKFGAFVGFSGFLY